MKFYTVQKKITLNNAVIILNNYACMQVLVIIRKNKSLFLNQLNSQSRFYKRYVAFKGLWLQYMTIMILVDCL